MAATQYAAWTVTAGEQPTTTKWNILGTNDSSFNTGVGINDGAISFRALASDVMPTGTMLPYAAVSAPSANWLLCDGAAVSRSAYPLLFSTIGTIFGSGDGTTTFNVPNMKGRAPFGVDAAQVEFGNIGTPGGQKIVQQHTHGVNDPSHAHGVSDPGHQHYSVDGGQQNAIEVGSSTNTLTTNGNAAKITWGNTVTSNAATNIGIYGNPTGITIQNAGTGGNNLNPYLTTNFIIKT